MRVPAVIGAWTHVVLAFDGASARIYQDGKYAGTTTQKFEPSRGSPWRLGSLSPAGAADSFVGAVDDLRMYGVALDAAQVADLYAGREPAPSAECRLKTAR